MADFIGRASWSSWAPKLRDALNAKYEFVHPEKPDDPRPQPHPVDRRADASPRRTPATPCFYGDKAIDRSPCGTGTSARMAQLAAKGRLKVGDEFVHE